MKNKHDEIKDLLKASRNLLSNTLVKEDTDRIRNSYGMLTEQDVTKKYDVAKSVSDTIEDDENEEAKEEKNQGYRISGGILVLHGSDKTDLELTTDEKIAFQETMDEFVSEVSDLVDFNRLNVYPRNVEWSGKIIDFDIQFYYTIGEENGVYIEGDMIKTDDKFLEMVGKLKSYYEKFKSKWAKVLASRKKTLSNG
jgi:hypothetical protein